MLSSLSAPAPNWVLLVARWIQWYGHGAEGHPDIKSGNGSVEDIVTHTKVVHDSLRAHAAPIRARAASNLETRSHRRTGDAQVGMYGPPNGTLLDWYVYLSDPNDFKAAASIEFGHNNVHPVTKKVSKVEGKWIIHDAAGLPHKGG